MRCWASRAMAGLDLDSADRPSKKARGERASRIARRSGLRDTPRARVGQLQKLGCSTCLACFAFWQP